MNFLGHFYLSQSDPELLVGNFIADYVKGKKYLDYPKKISEGIIMHRNIDFFTDRHPMVKQGKGRLFTKYRHYSGVIIDMYYDHFLASLWDDYSDDSLHTFSEKSYQIIESYWDYLPERSQYLFPYMKSGNWLLRYASANGIEQSLNGMSKRLNNNSKLDQAIHNLKDHYQEFMAEFREFIVDAKRQFN